MENINTINNTNLSQISTEDLLKETECLLKELEHRGYIVSIPKKTALKPLSTSFKPQKKAKEVKLNINCKKIFEEKSQQELVTLLNGYTKSEINEFYNQVTEKDDIKLSGSKEDYINAIVGLKRAMGSGKAFKKW